MIIRNLFLCATVVTCVVQATPLTPARATSFTPVQVNKLLHKACPQLANTCDGCRVFVDSLCGVDKNDEKAINDKIEHAIFQIQTFQRLNGTDVEFYISEKMKNELYNVFTMYPMGVMIDQNYIRNRLQSIQLQQFVQYLSFLEGRKKNDYNQIKECIDAYFSHLNTHYEYRDIVKNPGILHILSNKKKIYDAFELRK